MPTSRQGAIRLFRFSGIDVFLHWSWFLAAAYEINVGFGAYSSISWKIAEYLFLFLIVTLHEFGHALACRQVGGRANQIILWPLGGVAYVDPPPRPGATLWSIAAGPLVNVALVPVLLLLGKLSGALGLFAATPDLARLLDAVFKLDLYLLAFNILPIYPLDGGQILRSLLWFLLGRARSLLVATILGLAGVIAFFALALWSQSAWLGAIAIFMLLNCWSGLQQARALLRLAKLPRRQDHACPSCKTAPPIGHNWKCAQCGQFFDMFDQQGVCPFCRARFSAVRCMECGAVSALDEWRAPVVSMSSPFTNQVSR